MSLSATPLPESPSGEITHGDSRLKINEIIGEAVSQKAYAFATNTLPVAIGSNPLIPSFLPLSMIKSHGITMVDPVDGSFRNDTGRTIEFISGTISFQPDKTGGGVAVVDLISERSTDGVTWLVNSGSLRSVEVGGNGESFKTMLSSATDWPSGTIIRFRVYASAGGSVDFIPPSETVLGQIVTGPSVALSIVEA